MKNVSPTNDENASVKYIRVLITLDQKASERYVRQVKFSYLIFDKFDHNASLEKAFVGVLPVRITGDKVLQSLFGLHEQGLVHKDVRELRAGLEMRRNGVFTSYSFLVLPNPGGLGRGCIEADIRR